MNLTDDQKGQILEYFKEDPSLITITQKMFGGYDVNGEKDPKGEYDKDGRRMTGLTKEGRAIRKFLAEQGKSYDTTKSEKKEKNLLTDEIKQILMSDKVTSAMKPLEITRMVFQNPDLHALSSELRCVQEFLTLYRPDVSRNASIAGQTWHPPKTLEQTVARVNRWCDIKLSTEASNLSTKHKRCIEKLKDYLSIFRFGCTINSFKLKDDRELFESEFVRATWDKPDLTVDEINLYQMICSNYVRAKHIQAKSDSFSAMLENEELESSEISMKLTEAIKQINEELNACEKRIESLTHKLNGSRAERLKNQQKNAGNILDLVRTFQEQEGREMMVKMGDMRQKLVKKEAERIESLDEFKARVFGIEPEELL